MIIAAMEQELESLNMEKKDAVKHLIYVIDTEGRVGDPMGSIWYRTYFTNCKATRCSSSRDIPSSSI